MTGGTRHGNKSEARREGKVGSIDEEGERGRKTIEENTVSETSGRIATY